MQITSCLLVLMVLSVFLGDTEAQSYKKLEKKHCYYDKYGSYETLDEAIVACNSDKNCSKVYDDGCDNEGPFALCPRKSAELNASLSCLYVKRTRQSRLLEEHCPEGYTFQEGDAEGTQFAIRGPSGLLYNPFSVIDNCAKLCNGIDQCKAIEWSPLERKCVLIKTPSANGPKYQDYIFCSKETDEDTSDIDDQETIDLQALLRNCIRKNSKCVKNKQHERSGPSCSKLYSQCVAKATSPTGQKRINLPR